MTWMLGRTAAVSATFVLAVAANATAQQPPPPTEPETVEATDAATEDPDVGAEGEDTEAEPTDAEQADEGQADEEQADEEQADEEQADEEQADAKEDTARDSGWDTADTHVPAGEASGGVSADRAPEGEASGPEAFENEEHPDVVMVEGSPAPAESLDTIDVERRPGLDDLGSHQSFWWLGIGVRTSYVNDSGYDPFSHDDALVQFSVDAGRTVLASKSLSMAAGIEYQVGATSADARGDGTDLRAHRILFAPEVRNHLWSRMYAFAQPAIGALRTRASLDDNASGVTLEHREWGVAVDLTAGLAYQLYGSVSGDDPTPRLWISAEGGYGWSQKQELVLSPEEGASGPARIAPLELGDLTLRGPAFQISATLSY